jgi:hypothetical protein
MWSGQGDARPYDAILIDEAPDFEPSWFKCAVATLKDRHRGGCSAGRQPISNVLSQLEPGTFFPATIKRTAVSGREGGRFLLGKSKDLGQSPHNDDLAMAPLLARMDFDPIDEQTNDLYNLWACRLILQQVLQPRYLPAAKIR